MSLWYDSKRTGSDFLRTWFDMVTGNPNAVFDFWDDVRDIGRDLRDGIDALRGPADMQAIANWIDDRRPGQYSNEYETPLKKRKTNPRKRPHPPSSDEDDRYTDEDEPDDDPDSDYSDMPSDEAVTVQQDVSTNYVRNSKADVSRSRFADRVYSSLFEQVPARFRAWKHRFTVSGTGTAVAPSNLRVCIETGFAGQEDTGDLSAPADIGYNGCRDMRTIATSDNDWKENVDVRVNSWHKDITLTALNSSFKIDLYYGYFTEDLPQPDFNAYLAKCLADAGSIPGVATSVNVSDYEFSPFQVPRLGESVKIYKTQRVYLKNGDLMNFQMHSQKVGFVDHLNAWNSENTVEAGTKFVYVVATPTQSFNGSTGVPQWIPNAKLGVGVETSINYVVQTAFQYLDG